MPIGDIRAGSRRFRQPGTNSLSTLHDQRSTIHVCCIIAQPVEPFYDSGQGGDLLAREQRRLAAIVAADVVGYSRLMGRDEAGTVARLRSVRTARLQPVLNRRGGQVVTFADDGALLGAPLLDRQLPPSEREFNRMSFDGSA